VFMACVPVEQVNFEADVDIRLLVGPEVVAGSTRLKAGTVTKMALNIAEVRWKSEEGRRKKQ